jgi:hypothetical protein
MNIVVTPVQFKNRNNRMLYGMLHEPYDRRFESAIILLSAGIKSRVGPHRIYIKMADRFCAHGFVVMRLDSEGLGDSEGEINESLTANVYGSMELGRLVTDAIDAMDWMQAQYGIGRFILSGLCGGAITGLLAGARDDRVESLLGLGIPVIHANAGMDRQQYLTEIEWERTRKKYLNKILQPRSWIRFFSFKSNYRLLLQSFLRKVKSVDQLPDLGKNAGTVGISEERRDNFNHYFLDAFTRFAKKRKILFIFGEADRLWWEYQEKFENRYSETIRENADHLKLKIIRDSNHVLSFKEWHEQAINISSEWLLDMKRS